MGSKLAKRLFDIAVSGAAFTAALPVIAAAATAVKIASPGPILYRARRAGFRGQPFIMHKLRTMHVAKPGEVGAAITAADDSRVFPLGVLLRKLKIDELPQLFDVLRGKMSIVGPRPEDWDIVQKHYGEEGLRTLDIKPGLTSPGSIYYYTVSEGLLTGAEIERIYIEDLLPLKLAIDAQYLERQTLAYDIAIIFRTAKVIVQIALGQKEFADPPEVIAARESMRGRRAGSISHAPQYPTQRESVSLPN